MENIFTHGVGRADFIGDMVRIEFVSLSPGVDSDTPQSDATHAVFVPLNGFLRSLDVFNSLVEQLTTAGLVAQPVIEAGEPKTVVAPFSPNFS